MRSSSILAAVGLAAACCAVQSSSPRDQEASSGPLSSIRWHGTGGSSVHDPVPVRYGFIRPRQGEEQQPGVLNATLTANASITAMNAGFYDVAQGRWAPDVAWWTSGVALQAILDYMWKTGSREYMAQAEHIVALQSKPLPWYPQGNGSFRADSTDDTGWWALAMVRMFDLTGNMTYLNYTILDEEFMHTYWSTSYCDGGIFVDISQKTYKNAIANQLYMAVAASLHNRLGANDTKYLDRAVATWNWIKGSGMINGDNLINDGLARDANGTCYNNKLPIWTYNQGVVLGGLVELYRATNNDTYLSEAKEIANAVIASNGTLGLSPGGILTDPCEYGKNMTGLVSCNNDQQIFKGIFANNLALLNHAIPDRPYYNYLRDNALSAYNYARNASDFYDLHWTGPFHNSTISKQASAVSLWVAVI